MKSGIHTPAKKKKKKWRSRERDISTSHSMLGKDSAGLMLVNKVPKCNKKYFSDLESHNAVVVHNRSQFSNKRSVHKKF